MIKTYLKTLWRMFEKHVTRLLSLIFMVLVSVGFIAGIGLSTNKIDSSLNEYYKAQNVSDLIIRNTNEEGSGFSEDDIAKIKQTYSEENVNFGNILDISVPDKEYRSVRYCFLDFNNWTVNVPDLIEGEMPENEFEILVERGDTVIEQSEVGTSLTIDFYNILKDLSAQNGVELDGMQATMLERLEPKSVTVSGIIQSPLTFANDAEPSDNNPEDFEMPDSTATPDDMDCLERIYYISVDLIPTYKDIMSFLEATPIISTGVAYVTLENRNLFNNFSSGYKKVIDDEVKNIENEFSDVKVLTLYENRSFVSLDSYSKKVAAISYVLMVAFLLVTALVVLSTMTRLLEEERSQIACLKTLGYSSMGIISKYLLFALIATGIGGFGAYFVGLGLAYFIYEVFGYSFAMPPMSSSVAMVFYIITFALIVVATLAATAIAGLKMTGERPAELLRPRPPRAGKKVLIERIPVIWNRLSFKYKSTMRNVFRYKSRFIMTIVAVALSTSLVMAGLALLDLCLFHDFGSEAIMGISIVIIVFAGLLTATVIYTLTNINISERNREIATLMVLGYYDKEVTGYIYREIYINSVIGIIFGYPLSALLIWVVFKLMSFGVLGEVSWFMWLIAPFVVMLFTCLVTLILFRKIVKIDMNESLKAIE